MYSNHPSTHYGSYRASTGLTKDSDERRRLSIPMRTNSNSLAFTLLAAGPDTPPPAATAAAAPPTCALAVGLPTAAATLVVAAPPPGPGRLAALAVRQGPTLFHFSASHERFLWHMLGGCTVSVTEKRSG